MSASVVPGCLYRFRSDQWRKVYVVLGWSRVAGKVRIRRWRNATRRWTNPSTCVADLLEPAPEEWEATKRAAQHVREALS